MLLKCTWGNIRRVYRGVLSYEQVVSVIRACNGNISAVTPPPIDFCNIFLRVAGSKEIFATEGWLIKGRVAATAGVITLRRC